MISAEELAGITAPLEQATTLPPHCYIEPAVFEREKRAIFAHEWVCVGRAEQIPEPGDYFCTELVGQPLVVVRQKDGRVHAMSSVCLHRAMPVCSGRGNAASFSCPYHLWKYSLEGRLISAPMMDDALNFDPATLCLPEVRVEVWLGFVLVNLDPEAVPLAPRLERLETMLANYSLADLVVAESMAFDSPWNWKLLAENFMEAYHHIGPHKDTLQPAYPAKRSYVVADEEHLWSALHMPGVDEDDEEEPLLPWLPAIDGRQKHHLIACIVSPTLLFALNGNSVFWYQMTPRAHDRIDLVIHVLVHRDTAADPDNAEKVKQMAELARFVHLEDVVVNEGPWQGLHAPLARPGRLSLMEEAIWHMNQFWTIRMVESA